MSKSFRRPRKAVSKSGYTTIKSSLLSLFGKKADTEEIISEKFIALNKVSLNVTPGKALGVIGRNGSGKSTLLKLVSGIYHPDSGTVKVSGRLSALIELGAGFHPDFTGRENIYLGGIMYGLTRAEIERRIPAIIKYAELEDFIDAPVRTYSSGMYMRLGFSLAVHTDPDILLVDEVLAVGDAAFVHRCQDTISEFKEKCKTLLFVTHDLTSVVRWCDEVIWLDKGIIRLQGEPRFIVDAYLEYIGKEEEAKLVIENKNYHERLSPQEQLPTQSLEDRRWGSGDVEITDVLMLNALDYKKEDKKRWLWHEDDSIVIEVGYKINKPIRDLVFGVGITRIDGLDVHGTNTGISDIEVPLPSDNVAYPVSGIYRYKINRLSLTENTYYLDVAAHARDGFPYDYHHRLYTFSVRSSKPHVGVFSPEHEWEFLPNYPVSEAVDNFQKRAQR